MAGRSCSRRGAGAAGALKSRIDAVPMAGGARHVVVDDASYPLTSMPGQLLFQRSGALYGASFDPASARIVGTSGEAVGRSRASSPSVGSRPTSARRAISCWPTPARSMAACRGSASMAPSGRSPRPCAATAIRACLPMATPSPSRTRPRSGASTRCADRRSASSPATRVSPAIRSGRLTARTSTSAHQPASSACAPTAAERRRRCPGRRGSITRAR